ncbi:leucine-rich repeat domain-containing protein [Gilvimarinus sp. DA14]|uniref:leucine-rich repeat domain-containing protein n=1 Tax=Gilvimarinus sp. DA14 TaxID=2956798 RepID=UPI0020B7C536|nr:leucine-rich repeat domain-containing protein [Gilvimarinus sp. DA14]UTF61061.1 leucine-rich repeat domain-containing protein [Gilvimarinus sp. DA14]
MKTLIRAAALTLIGGCSQYDISVNDNVVYTPKPLLKESSISDENLKTCIEQAIQDRKVTAVSQLTRLQCSHAGVTNLAGLERYFAIAELDLADNQITDISTLGRLGKLTLLHLENNHISDAAPLLSLIKLTDVNLEGNSDVQCRDLQQVKQAVTENNGSILLPEHC